MSRGTADLPPGTPVHVTCVGRPADMGRAQGATLTDEGHLSAVAGTLWLSAAPAAAGGIPARLRRMGGRFGRLVWSRCDRDLSHHIPRQWQRQQGIALGAGRPLAEAAVAPFVERLVGPVVAPIGSVVACGSSADGPFAALRIDGPASRRAPLMLRSNRPDHDLADVDLCDGASAGSLAGVNERGLILTCNHRLYSAPGAAMVPPSLLCKEVLERAGTVDAALRMIRRWPATQSSLIVLVDRGGALATVDITDRASPRRHRRPVIATNHGLGSPPGWPSWRRVLPGKLGHDGIPSSVRRLAELRQRHPDSVDRAVAALAALPPSAALPALPPWAGIGSAWGLRPVPLCTVVLRAALGSVEAYAGAPPPGREHPTVVLAGQDMSPDRGITGEPEKEGR